MSTSLVTHSLGARADGQQRPWFPCGTPCDPAKLRIFAFPHAGGGASLYLQWRQLAREQLELCPIQLPGRETRITEPPVADAALLLPTLMQVIGPHLRRPYVLMGHSLGGMLAFALAERIEAAGLPPPNAVVVLASNPAPQAEARRHWTDARLAKFIRELGATPDEVLENPELRELILPRLRADFALLDSLIEYCTGRIITPIIAFSGTRDRGVPPRVAARWRDRTEASFATHVLPGNHFFPRSLDAAQIILDTVSRAVAPMESRETPS